MGFCMELAVIFKFLVQKFILFYITFIIFLELCTFNLILCMCI